MHIATGDEIIKADWTVSSATAGYMEDLTEFIDDLLMTNHDRKALLQLIELYASSKAMDAMETGSINIEPRPPVKYDEPLDFDDLEDIFPGAFDSDIPF